MLAKTPVIASDVGGISEFVQHEINGLLFERGNSEDLSLILRRIIDNPELIKKLKSGILKVKDIDEEVDELELIYLKLISNTKYLN